MDKLSVWKPIRLQGIRDASRLIDAHCDLIPWTWEELFVARVLHYLGNEAEELAITF